MLIIIVNIIKMLSKMFILPYLNLKVFNALRNLI